MRSERRNCVCVWGFPGPRWGDYSAPPDPLAGFWGGEGVGKGRGEKGRWREGGRRLSSAPKTNSWIRLSLLLLIRA